MCVWKFTRRDQNKASNITNLTIKSHSYVNFAAETEKVWRLFLRKLRRWLDECFQSSMVSDAKSGFEGYISLMSNTMHALFINKQKAWLHEASSNTESELVEWYQIITGWWGNCAPGRKLDHIYSI